MKSPTKISIFLLSILLLQSSSPCFSSTNSKSLDDSIYKTFLNCLLQNNSNKSTNQTELTNFLYSSQANQTTYTRTLRAYIRNARFNTTSTPKPQLIFTPTKPEHVQAAVVCSKKLGHHVRVRSGGHDYEGISYKSDRHFLILDMFNIKKVEVDLPNEAAWVESGATLGDVYYGIWKQSKVHSFPAGVCPTVGVGGHLSGGGYGYLLRKYGLSVDNVVDAKIVDVNGRLLDRQAMGEDFFWALRGGGGASFGVIVAYKIKLVRVPEKVTVFRVEQLQDQGNALDVTYKWQFVAPSTSNDLFMRLLLQPATSKLTKGVKTVRTTIMTMYLGDSDSLVSLLGQEFPELGLKKEDCIELNWMDAVLWWSNFNNGTASPEALLDRNLDSSYFLKRKSDYVQNPITKDGLDWIFKKLVELDKTGFVFNPYGGKMSEISPSETPFPHRAGNLFKIQYSVNWVDGSAENEKNYITQIRRLYSYMTPFVSKNPRSAFLNYRDLDIGVTVPGKSSFEDAKIYGHKYFKGNFDRLVKVKTAVDPENFFWNEQSIPSLSSKA